MFVTGGVVSSLGKGVAAASMGCLLESRGLRVTLQKCDPYLNVDPGTMSPYQHGEVFVTDDGAETDLDLGHYERFTSAHLTRDHNWTTGRIYESIIAKERRGDYLGKTVQVIPHVTDEIKAAFRKVADGVDIVIVEIGGTVGDIESLPFLEAIRQMRLELGAENVVFAHLTLVPFIATAGELKTKPTQHSVKEMLSIGIQPDILICRSDRPLGGDLKAKIALFCNMAETCVISAPDVGNIYEVPMTLASEGLDEQILRLLHLEAPPRDLSRWLAMLETLEKPQGEVRIGVVGKYVQLEDAYKSLREALVARRARQSAARGHRMDRSGRNRFRRPRPSACCATWTEFWFPVDSASAASREWSTPSLTRARKRFRFSESAWACSAPPSSTRARFRSWIAPIAPSSIPRRPTA